MAHPSMICSFNYWRHQTHTHHMSLFSLWGFCVWFLMCAYMIWLAMAKQQKTVDTMLRLIIHTWCFEPKRTACSYVRKESRESATKTARYVTHHWQHKQQSGYREIRHQHITSTATAAVPCYMFHCERISRSLHVQREYLHQGCSPQHHRFVEIFHDYFSNKEFLPRIETVFIRVFF